MLPAAWPMSAPMARIITPTDEAWTMPSSNTNQAAGLQRDPTIGTTIRLAGQISVLAR